MLDLIPKGGGGTSFINVFNYIEKLEEPPKAVIIITDGYAAFPEKDYTEEFSVVWLINNKEITPPWGKVGRFSRKN